MPITTLDLKVLSPIQDPIHLKALSVTLPGLLGEMGVLPRHVPMLIHLKAGVVKVKTKEGLKKIEISEGLAEILHYRVTLLVENIKAVDDLKS